MSVSFIDREAALVKQKQALHEENVQLRKTFADSEIRVIEVETLNARLTANQSLGKTAPYEHMKSALADLEASVKVSGKTKASSYLATQSNAGLHKLMSR